MALALMLVVSLSPGQDQPPSPGFGYRMANVGPLGLLSMDAVRKELSVSDEQNKELDDVLEKFDEAVGSFPRDLRKLTDEERPKRMKEMRTKLREANKAAEEKIDKILNPEQLARLRQLSVQQRGIHALIQPDVAKELELSQEQQDKIWKILQGTWSQDPDKSLSAEEKRELVAAIREREKNVRADLLALLSEKQKRKWADMKGRDFTFLGAGRDTRR
ncbi:MAG TPA: hypothetical protein VHC22_33745 [Pirellulales bacterium]|nr:hypothetical protein [Pirellulales bacterium]